MSPEPHQHVVAPGQGEVLKLGPPTPGEIIITVDPKRTGSSIAVGTETILPGAAIPVHRHLEQDEVLFVHKGQGRATLDGKAMTVVPGTMVYVPRTAWHGLRNTGTGALQITWTSAPPGIEEFFREISQLPASADAATVQAIAQRHGIEFHPTGEPAEKDAAGAGAGRRRRHRGHGRRGARGQRQPAPAPASRGASPPGLPAAPAQAHPAPPPPQPPSQGPRRHRRRRRRSGAPAAAQPVRTTTTPPPPPSAPPPARTPGSPARRQPPGRGGQRPRRGRVKEVYIDGRWVQVTGEGPVIAPGKRRPGSGRGASHGDDDSPGGPLSVSL